MRAVSETCENPRWQWIELVTEFFPFLPLTSFQDCRNVRMDYHPYSRHFVKHKQSTTVREIHVISKTHSRLGAQALAVVVLGAAALWLAGPAVFQMTQCLSSDYRPGKLSGDQIRQLNAERLNK